MITAIAIDDEPLALQIIKEHAAQVKFLNLKECFTNAIDAIQYLSANKVDVVFADIQMPDLTGIQFAEQNKNTQIVFTTAYPDYALKGFELDVTDYLLKPISLLRFLQACQKVQKRLSHSGKTDEVYIKDSGEWIKINPESLLYAEAQGNYLKLVLKDAEHLLRLTFNDLSTKLTEPLLRTHKSFAVNPSKIDRIETHQITIGTKKIPVGSSYKNEMMAGLGLV